jgi:hypothetical protein
LTVKNVATGKFAISTARRIELLPSPNPDVQQVIVAGNGGTPLYPNQDSVTTPTNPNPPPPVQRDNELVKLPDGTFRNIYDGNGDGIPDAELISPIVAIPVANMSLSEPLDLYEGRRRILQAQEDANRQGPPGTTWTPVSHYWDPYAAQGEGMYTQNAAGGGNEGPYTTPFDEAPELRRNGTTRNYRTVHLQRLADPTLPWNPLPTLPGPNGTTVPNPQHDPNLPVNVYRTIDTASVDLTTFNGTSRREATMANASIITQIPTEPRPYSPNSFQHVFGFQGRSSTDKHRLSFRSLERGAHATDQTTAGNLLLAPRLMWRQEPETRFDPTDNFDDPKTNDMLEWHPLTTDAERQTWLEKRANDLRIRDVGTLGQPGELLKDIATISATGMDPAFNNFPDELKPQTAHFDIVMEHSLGIQNEAFGALTTVTDLTQQGLPAAARGTPMPDSDFSRAADAADDDTIESTFPWLAWGNRPFVSAQELLAVPATSSSQLLRDYTTMTPGADPRNPYNGTGFDPTNGGNPMSVAVRLATSQAPFGHLLPLFHTADLPARVLTDAAGAPVLDADGNWVFMGAPHFYRLLEYVQVPSRYVGTDTLLTAEIFNDVPAVADDPTTSDPATDGNIDSPADPRYSFQPPFNKVSRQRDPGKVNLNTVTGHREQIGTNPRHWSEVFDGIMHRVKDGNLLDPAGKPQQLGHLGPTWRDVVLSRKGYAPFSADGSGLPLEKLDTDLPPHVFSHGLNPNFPSIISNPFRSPNAGDLVPLPQMVHYGVDAYWLRGHHFNRGPGVWGAPGDDNGDGSVDDTREAGFGRDELSYNSTTGALLPIVSAEDRGIYPLFSESFTAPYVDGERNPNFYYQPMTRLANLVTNRSNVFAVWITVGYFEVEKAPGWNDTADTNRNGMPDGQEVQLRMGGDINLYNRVYPDGFMLGKEVGSDTGDVQRHRGFYIIDRTEEVGFKPGEDLNVEKMIRLRRRID